MSRTGARFEAGARTLRAGVETKEDVPGPCAADCPHHWARDEVDDVDGLAPAGRCCAAHGDRCPGPGEPDGVGE